LSAWGRKGSWAVGGVAQHILLSTVCVFVVVVVGPQDIHKIDGNKNEQSRWHRGKRTKTREVGEEDCRINPITTGNKDPKYKLFNQSPAF